MSIIETLVVLSIVGFLVLIAKVHFELRHDNSYFHGFYQSVARKILTLSCLITNKAASELHLSKVVIIYQISHRAVQKCVFICVNVLTIIICVKAPPSLCKREEGMTLTLASFCDYYQILSLSVITLNTNKILVVQVQNIIITV